MIQDDEVTLDVVEEEVNDTVEVAEEVVTETEEAKDNRVELKMTPAEYRHYKKWKDSDQAPAQVKTQATPQPNVEEVVLQANGMPDELLTQLKKVAAINGTSLIKAQNDPIFVAVKEKFEKDKKHSEASLPATRGSGTVRAQKSLETPGLTREEHAKLAKDALGL